jgi:hypothetical protein
MVRMQEGQTCPQEGAVNMKALTLTQPWATLVASLPASSLDPLYSTMVAGRGSSTTSGHVRRCPPRVHSVCGTFQNG